MSGATTARFPNYTLLPARVPLWAWRTVRAAGVAVALAIVVGLFVRPAGALFAFWRLVIPLVPLLLVLAPGVWRNLCPLATVNQTPRLLSWTKALNSPAWLREYGYVISITLFLAVVVNRKVVFNTNGPALGVLLIVIFIAAFVGGATLKGKSGWCSSMCPVLPVQRIYGQTPFVLVRQSHCEPCLGCTKNCYDFNPTVAYVADMYDEDRSYAAYRRWFIGIFPGFVLAYFHVPGRPSASVSELYTRTAVYAFVSLAVFLTLDVFAKATPNVLPPLFGAAAFVIFYWYTARLYPLALSDVFDRDLSRATWPIRAGVVALALVWLWRCHRVERMFVDQAVAGALAVKVEINTARQLRAATESAGLEVTFEPGDRVVAAKPGASVLEVAERAGLKIEAGCRMGVCGADPVNVEDGLDNLSPVRPDEADTLERLGLGGQNRMACCARISGPCRVNLQPDRTSVAVPRGPTFTADESVRRVVIVGNGIAGMTAADFVRRHHESVEIDVIGREPHQLYNRMGISRLIYGRSAMQGLYLLPADWLEAHRVREWLNTIATSIDLAGHEVVLGTGERVPYDRLVLATGSSSTMPDLPGLERAGCFVLREAQDAIEIRRSAQQVGLRHAVIAGGGLLGLECAHALRELGLGVTIVERSERLLRRQLDVTGSAVLQAYFESLGIEVATNAVPASVEGGASVECLALQSGQRLPCGVLVMAAGITPNVALASECGLAVGRGVLVDESMRTSDPDVFAVGDVAEVNGRIWGLWPVAVTQAQVAAANAVGGDMRYHDTEPTTILKGVGLDVVAFGTVAGEPDAMITDEQPTGHRHRMVHVRDGSIVGGVFLGFPDEAAWARAAYESGADVSVRLAAMRRGEWDVSG